MLARPAHPRAARSSATARAVLREPRCVRGIGGEPASEVDLTVVAAEDLVVGGEDAHLVAGTEVDLHAGAGEVAHPSMSSSTTPPRREVVAVPLAAGPRPGRAAAAGTAPDGSTLEHDVAVARAAVVVLDDDATDAGAGRRMRSIAATTSSTVVHVLAPGGSGDPACAAKSRRPALLNATDRAPGRCR